MTLFTLLLLSQASVPLTWEQSQQRGLDAIRQGRYTEAAAYFQSARQTLPPDAASSLPALLSNEGAARQQAGDFRAATQLLQQALTAWQNLPNPNPDHIARTHNNLAVLFRHQMDLASAARHAQQSIALSPTPIAFHTLAEIHRLAGRFPDAASALDQSARLLAESPDILTQANLLQARGSLLEQQRQPAAAEPFFRDAARLLETHYGRLHPVTLAAYNNYAQNILTQMRFDDAHPILEAQYTAVLSTLGPNHPRTAAAANNLAQLYRARHQFELAAPLYRQCLQIWAATFGERHPEYARGLHNLAGLFAEQGKFQGAEKLYLQAIDIAAQALGKAHPQTQLHVSGLDQLYLHTRRHTQRQRLQRTYGGNAFTAAP